MTAGPSSGLRAGTRTASSVSANVTYSPNAVFTIDEFRQPEFTFYSKCFRVAEQRLPTLIIYQR